MIGTRIGGRYVVRRLIGDGGMGQVFEAEHIEIGRRVAIKVLLPEFNGQADVPERFRLEARAATRIGSPHIIDVFDSGTTPEGNAYFVMEYLDGIDLAELIRREAALPPARAIRICRQICKALAAAHRAGIIHRDMKPDNVFLIERGGQKDFVKVLDFGIAKAHGDRSRLGGRLTIPGMLMGTPEYMAPEQAKGAAIDGRTDVYAVGSILYELLTGRPPFQGSTLSVLNRKFTAKPIRVRTLRSDVSADLERLVMRCLALSPDKRPQSMDALGAALDWLQRPPRGAMRLPTGRTRRALIFLAAVVAVATIALGALSLRRSSGQLASQIPVAEAHLPAPLPVKASSAATATPPLLGVQKTGSVSIGKQPDSIPGEARKPYQAPHHQAAGVDPAALAGAKRELADAYAALTGGRLAQAQSLYAQVDAAGIERGRALTGLAHVAFYRGDYSEAVGLAKRASSAGGGVQASLMLAMSYFRAGQSDLAIREFRSVLRSEPTNEEARAGLAAAEKRKFGN